MGKPYTLVQVACSQGLIVFSNITSMASRENAPPAMATATGITSSLPCEVILEILSRLPTPTLATLKDAWDPHPWGRPLQSPSFLNKHALNMMNKPQEHAQIIISACAHDNKAKDTTIHRLFLSGFSSPRLPSVKLEPLFSGLYHKANLCRYRAQLVVGSCNGLLCLSLKFIHFPDEATLPKPTQPCCGACYVMSHRKWRSHIVLWNPITEEYFALPDPTRLLLERSLSSSYSDWDSIKWGFGYHVDSSYKRMSFKVVVAEGSITEFYDLSTNSWECFENIVDWKSVVSQMGQFLDGAIHWITVTDILCIDLATKACRRMSLPLPNGNVESRPRSWELGVFGGRLVVSRDQSPNSLEVDIWVMEKYGQEGSWVKLLTVLKPSTDIVALRPPLGVNEDGGVVFQVKEKLALWYPGKDKFIYVEECEFKNALQGVIHVDTLLSPKPQDWNN